MCILLVNEEPTFIEKAISSLPEREHFETFGRDENPVEFVMKQMSSIYPDIYQDPDVLKALSFLLQHPAHVGALVELLCLVDDM